MSVAAVDRAKKHLDRAEAEREAAALSLVASEAAVGASPTSETIAEWRASRERRDVADLVVAHSTRELARVTEDHAASEHKRHEKALAEAMKVADRTSFFAKVDASIKARARLANEPTPNIYTGTPADVESAIAKDAARRVEDAKHARAIKEAIDEFGVAIKLAQASAAALGVDAPKLTPITVADVDRVIAVERSAPRWASIGAWSGLLHASFIAIDLFAFDQRLNELRMATLGSESALEALVRRGIRFGGDFHKLVLEVSREFETPTQRETRERNEAAHARGVARELDPRSAHLFGGA